MEEDIRPEENTEDLQEDTKSRVEDWKQALREFPWYIYFGGAVTGILAAAMILMIYISATASQGAGSPFSLGAFAKIWQVERIIRTTYVEDYDEQKLTDGLYEGLVAGLEDPYADYYTAEEYEEVRRSQSGKTQGIGIRITQNSEGQLLVDSVIAGSPAKEAGVLAGDIIKTINGTDALEMTAEEAAALIRGSESDTITLTVLREGEEIELSMTRGEIKTTSAAGVLLTVKRSGDVKENLISAIESAEEILLEDEEDAAATETESSSDSDKNTGTASDSKVTESSSSEDASAESSADDDSAGNSTDDASAGNSADDADRNTVRIGYIQIASFNSLTPEQFAGTWEGLQAKGMEAVIIDLRDNPGGLVASCVDTLSVFMPEGPVVYEKDRDGNEYHRDSTGSSPTDLPLVLLVNKGSASASEIFAGAVQDYEVGTIVGTTTYGKGVEQNSYTLRDGSVVKLTTVHYYTPSRRDINGTGLEPDEEVAYDPEAEVDTQLSRAVELLMEKTAAAAG